MIDFVHFSLQEVIVIEQMESVESLEVVDDAVLNVLGAVASSQRDDDCDCVEED